ncbi:MAG: hypothetical protein GPJ54_20830, partial [Candidatus Heimdallarchaeota archaeon]|nr:hypothetical protein [Candidatus Heimdallarchaeota archaeon]
GVHTFIITVVDKSGNYLTDTVLVIVDGTLPDVTSPSSINYSEFSIGNTITWLLGDKNPDVYNINQNGTPFEETTQWSNGSITINIDGLSLGVYEFSITVYDENGNFRPHTVIVTVIDDKIPSINLINGIVEGAIVEGSILIEITPSDEHGIERVEFLIDDIDACVDIADTTCDLNNDLYSLSLDTRNLNDGTHSLQIVVTDTANNSYTEVILFTVQNEVGSDGFNIPTVISIAIIALSGLGVTGGALRIRQRRRMDKAFDDLQSDFEGSEITGEGKSE